MSTSAGMIAIRQLVMATLGHHYSSNDLGTAPLPCSVSHCWSSGSAESHSRQRGNGELCVAARMDDRRANGRSRGGVAAALIIGAIAGLYPALRAARMSPTKALRTV